MAKTPIYVNYVYRRITLSFPEMNKHGIRQVTHRSCLPDLDHLHDLSSGDDKYKYIYIDKLSSMIYNVVVTVTARLPKISKEEKRRSQDIVTLTNELQNMKDRYIDR
jgi:hypothetical protein